jgi:hypothetical protein
VDVLKYNFEVLIKPEEPGTFVNEEDGINNGLPFKEKLPSNPERVNTFTAKESIDVLVKEAEKVPAQ